MIVYRLAIFSGIGHQELCASEDVCHKTVEMTFDGKTLPKYKIDVLKVHDQPRKIPELDR